MIPWRSKTVSDKFEQCAVYRTHAEPQTASERQPRKVGHAHQLSIISTEVSGQKDCRFEIEPGKHRLWKRGPQRLKGKINR